MCGLRATEAGIACVPSCLTAGWATELIFPDPDVSRGEPDRTRARICEYSLDILRFVKLFGGQPHRSLQELETWVVMTTKRHDGLRHISKHATKHKDCTGGDKRSYTHAAVHC